MTKIVKLHYVKFVFRSVLFLLAVGAYIYHRINNTKQTFGGFENNTLLLGFIWAVFLIEMVLRFFPLGLESMGCQKQFSKNYVPTGSEKKTDSKKTTLIVLASWLCLNLVFGILYLTGVFDRGIMLLISLAYSVCDVICILFFCPFQTWIMKNKCCGTCRIYNWDYAMMFTPLVFVKNIFSWSLIAAALLLLLRWEISFYKYPERFMEDTNSALSCKMCREKLCHHKKQLRSFLRKQALKGNLILKNKDKGSL